MVFLLLRGELLCRVVIKYRVGGGFFTEATGGSVCLLAPLGGAFGFAAACITAALPKRRGVAEAGEGGGGRSGVRRALRVSPYPRARAWVAARWRAQRGTPAAARGAEPPR